MLIGILQMDLYLSDSQSLKEKRMILKSLKARLRNNFNIAVSELDHHDKWQRSLVGAAAISNEKKALDKMLASIVEFVGRDRKVEIIDYSTEFL